MFHCPVLLIDLERQQRNKIPEKRPNKLKGNGEIAMI